ncbi:MAG: DUF2791 family P-loop domain-containing protein [Oscillospiraceae bacterium]|nr:DUF2791 family P-loop domain-containing protein [Oscillospiraceae bacterium]
MATIYDYEPLFGEWKIKERLGRGGFGEVYSVYKEAFGITQWAAVKRIELPQVSPEKDKALLDRVKAEIESMLKLKAVPHIVKIEDFAVVDWKRDKGQDILIRMELLTSLEEKLKYGLLPIDEVIKLGIHICRMLEICEKQNIIHRDIKPANIFVTEYGDYKLGDFGIARTLQDGSASTSIGTMDYIAPEVATFRQRYDSRVDIYSLGLTLYYLLNGNKLPFEGEDNEESPLVRRIDGEPLPYIVDVPNQFSNVVSRACSFKADNRFDTSGEFRRALEKCIALEPQNKANIENMGLDIPNIENLRLENLPQNRMILESKTTRFNFLEDFWKVIYLENYVKKGGSRVQFVTGKAGSGKSQLLRHFLEIADNYLTVSLSLKSMNHFSFLSLYTEIVNRIDILSCLQRCSERVVRALDFAPDEIGSNFLEFLKSKKLDDPITKREVRIQLGATFRDNPCINYNFALACTLLTGDILGYPVLEKPAKEAILSWLLCLENHKLPTLRNLGLSPSNISLHDARHMMQSLVEIIRMAGYDGLVVAIDDLEHLLSRDSLEEIRYTRIKREDAYESIRELIDKTTEMRHVMFLFAFENMLINDDWYGIKSYQALWFRVQNEILDDKVNPFSNLVCLDNRSMNDLHPLMEMLARTARGLIAMNYEKCRLIEPLRMGISSKEVAKELYGGNADLMGEMSEWMNSGTGDGRIITGAYGEGKTHLLNMAYHMAHKNNMVVSVVMLSKGTPISLLDNVYQSAAINTYLPDHDQPGFFQLLDKLSPSEMADLQAYAKKELQTNKLYYLLKLYYNTDDSEIKRSICADLLGAYMHNSKIVEAHRITFGEKVEFSTNFVESVHMIDYFRFLSRLFTLSRFKGWLILFNELELIGRHGRSTRFEGYANISKLLHGDIDNTYCLFALTNNYAMQVIEGKEERKHLAEANDYAKEDILYILSRIETAPEIPPMQRKEFFVVVSKIRTIHSQAYGWVPKVTAQELFETAWSCGYYLRTKIRAAVEYLDLQYIHEYKKNRA